MNELFKDAKELLTDPRFQVVIGMSIAYFASFLGMLLAFLSYRKRRRIPPSNARERTTKHEFTDRGQ